MVAIGRWETIGVVVRAAVLARGALLDVGEPLVAGPVSPAPDTGAARAALGTLEVMERNHILSVLDQTQWAIEGERGAARILGLNPSTLRGRLRKLGLRKNS